MASKTSGVNVVDRKSKGKSYYSTDVTTLADGSVQRQTYRGSSTKDGTLVDKVLIQSVTVNSEGEVIKDEVTSNATVDEQRDLRNPKSNLRQAIKTQVNSVTPDLKGDGNIDGVSDSTLDKAALGSGNAALNDVQTLESLNTAPAPASQSLSVADRADTRKSFPDCVYPLDLGKTKQDVIKFTMLEYVPKDFSQTTFAFSDRSEDRKGIGTVILPIPGGIQDTNSVEWSGQNMNAIDAELARLALSGITGGANKFFSTLQQQADAIAKNNSEVGTAAAAAFAGAATGTGGQLLTRTTGAVINPNLELLFSGPALRTFSFQFKLNAREAAESKEIVKIIRFFKQGSAAQKSKSHLFLKSPHTFAIQYLHRGPEGEPNPFMNKIKECALQSVAVNYTPEGNYATFDDGAMTSYELTLQFSELEPVFNNDYENDNDTTIGF